MIALGRIATAMGLTVLAVAPARAQWRVVILDPGGVNASQVLANTATTQVGRVLLSNGLYRPVRWNSTAQSFTDLLPAGWFSGQVNGIEGQYLVGTMSSQTFMSTHAILWLAGGEAFVDLHPGSGYAVSYGYDVAGDQQAGVAQFAQTGMYHAALWRGSAASFVDMHPASCGWSEVFATDGVRQGGWAQFPALGQIHAVLWAGSAASFVGMTPAGSRQSVIEGMAPGVQVGWGLFNSDNKEHAVVWHGTPQSAVRADPPGSRSARLFDTNGAIHAGYVNFTGWGEACIWTGDSPMDCKNLHPALGPGWFSSAAFSIAVKDGRVYVGGSAAQPGGNAKAVLWIGRLPERINPKPKPIPSKAPPG